LVEERKREKERDFVEHTPASSADTVGPLTFLDYYDLLFPFTLFPNTKRKDYRPIALLSSMYKVLTANLHLQSEPVPSKDSTSCRLTKQVSVLEKNNNTTTNARILRNANRRRRQVNSDNVKSLVGCLLDLENA